MSKSRETTFAAQFWIVFKIDARRRRSFERDASLKVKVASEKARRSRSRSKSPPKGLAGGGGDYCGDSTFRFKKEFTYEKSFDGVLLRFDFRVRGLDRFRARLRSVRRGRRPGRFVRFLLRVLHRRFVRTLQRAPLALGVPSVRRRRMRSVLRRGSGSGLRPDRFGEPPDLRRSGSDLRPGDLRSGSGLRPDVPVPETVLVQRGSSSGQRRLQNRPRRLRHPRDDHHPDQRRRLLQTGLRLRRSVPVRRGRTRLLRGLRPGRNRSGSDSVHAGRPVLQLSGRTERKRDLTVESTLTTETVAAI